MTTIINNPPQAPQQVDEGTGLGFVVALLLLVFFFIVVFYYGLPHLPSIQIPSKINISINK